ncbi:MAG: LacI family DNA-binding transcriptional regulator [Oscillospiraceae bacterium]|nr:LacI family transcriptional regulator [Oscillospiraceae bacterium]MDY4190742.1 LacI family DNA-binding transcriptional regulator [Oscillospiraceae bacterium]
MRPTIKDVAKKAGVSISTVSLVMNDRPVSLSPETRAAVLEAAKELGYRPNQLAVGLVTKKTNTIGLIIPDNSNIFFAAYTNHLEAAANELGYCLILGNSNGSPEKALHYLHLFADRGVDAIILAQSEFADPEMTKKCLETVRSLRIPVLLIDRLFRTRSIEAVVLDHFEGGYLAARHLIDLGHRRIGCLCGPLGLTSFQERLAGFRQALEECGIPYDPALVAEGDLLVESAAAALPSLLRQKVSAIFAFNDMMAYGVYKELYRLGIKIPEDISLIGFDDLFFSDVLQPPLTTVAQPLDKMARAAMLRLSQILKDESAGECLTQLFHPELKVRGSTSAPGKQFFERPANMK